MRFIDEAKIEVRAGNGGNGSGSFRREKHVPAADLMAETVAEAEAFTRLQT